MTAHALRIDSTGAAFTDDFARNRALLPGAGLAWLEARRRAALDAFAVTGVPTRRVEAWKYTDLANALDTEFEPAKRYHGPVANESPFAGVPVTRIVLVNGFLHWVDRYPPDAMEVADLSALDGEAPAWVKDHLGLMASGADQTMGALSLALMRGGVAVRVADKAATLRLEFVNPAQGYDWVNHSRVLIVVEEGASLKLLESHDGRGAERSLSNIGVEFVLKQGAKLEHIRVQASPEASLHIASIGAIVERDAEYRALLVASGARVARLDAHIRLAAPGARAVLNNVAAIGAGIADITTVMEHASPHTTSRQLFKNVVGGRGRAVNQGRVVVREGAVKSDSHQLFKSLLLSPRAEADAKPELEIFADDVVCGHGAAIGDLDRDALFYLRSRGIPEHEAKGLLVRAFLNEAIEGFAGEGVEDAIWRRLDAALALMEEETP